MPPSLALVLLVVALSGTAFHALFGRTWRGLAVSLGAALLGLVLGEILARFMGVAAGRVGSLHPAFGLVGAWLAMAVARRWVA